MASKIRESLLTAFSAAGSGYLSGQELAEKADCSRTAIWKHIEELRKDGFIIEAVKKKGYRLIGTTDRVTENEILIGLETKTLGRNVHFFETLQSTQIVAHQLAQENAPEGTLVVSEEQTVGRGRMARPWHSPPGTGVWMSLLLRPSLPPHRAPQFTLIAAVAVVNAIDDVCGIQAEIKWPNDVLIKGKKVTGILTELQADSERIYSIIIGIGMNVNQRSFPDELKAIATSLALETGSDIDRAKLIQRVLVYIERYYELYLTKGFAPIKVLWESYAVTIGKQVIARTISGTIEGVAKGITDEGVLLVEDASGHTHSIYSADIEPGT